MGKSVGLFVIFIFMNLLYYYCIGDGGDYEGITAGDSDDDSSEGGNDEEFARNLAQRQGNLCSTKFLLSHRLLFL